MFKVGTLQQDQSGWQHWVPGVSSGQVVQVSPQSSGATMSSEQQITFSQSHINLLIFMEVTVAKKKTTGRPSEDLIVLARGIWRKKGWSNWAYWPLFFQAWVPFTPLILLSPKFYLSHYSSFISFSVLGPGFLNTPKCVFALKLDFFGEKWQIFFVWMRGVVHRLRKTPKKQIFSPSLNYHPSYSTLEYFCPPYPTCSVVAHVTYI